MSRTALPCRNVQSFVWMSIALSCVGTTVFGFAPCKPSVLPGMASLRAKNEKQGDFTLKDLMEQMEKNPAAFQQQKEKTRKRNKRTRRRVDAPKQEYKYASQRRAEGGAASAVENESSPIFQARKFGLVNAAAQQCDALVDEAEPVIVGQIRVGDESTTTSGTMAYVINKPAGWSILGSATKKKEMSTTKSAAGASEQRHTKAKDEAAAPIGRKQQKDTVTVKIKDEDGSEDVLEFSELDILAAMTPEERAEFEAEGGLKKINNFAAAPKVKTSSRPGTREAASFASPARPSVVLWLKDTKAAEGTPIRGGKYWTAVAGATNVDDTGLVVVCPKDKVSNVYVDYAKYVVVMGNGKHVAPKGKTKEPEIPRELTKMEIMSKVRKGRGDDTVFTVVLTFLERFSTCTSVVQPCQKQFLDGIRGDPAANPLERRAPRRLIHCDSLSVSSLVHDDTVQAQTVSLPDDIRILSDRRNHHEYSQGSFLGRSSLRENPLTNTYREINGAADGFFGWTVDRYDKWLLVQHDEKAPRGPLPSIHDGNTAGVYYLPANPHRSAMGSKDEIRPTLLEGQAAPDVFPVRENGITYHVSLERDLSTGIFLDQRPQRAWLARNCNEDTRMLNCFAHCGAFSVAAATAGATTVSLDLEKKWLDRIEPQMNANGIDFDKHDCIYGDCFDWLARLGKRGETYDIVILDPPSTSVGKKKKRWSVKNDMGSLVALAAPLVKKGGLLWTTTNNASIPHVQFARMCKRGLDDAGLAGAKLERVVPMPVDFSAIGPQPVKNFVWRLP